MLWFDNDGVGQPPSGESRSLVVSRTSLPLKIRRVGDVDTYNSCLRERISTHHGKTAL